MADCSVKYLLGFLILVFSLEAHAQTMGVRGGKLRTFANQVSVKVEPRNPTKRPMLTQVRVYDHNFKLIKARVKPREFRLPAGGRKVVTVTVPFLGAQEKWFRICTEGVPDKRNSQQIRTRVCGRFYAQRLLQQ